MKNPNDGFIKGRLRSVTFAFKGMWLLITTEDSIKAQVFLGILATCLGWYFNLSETQWLFQFLIIGMVLVAEALNTAVEKIADFIHPDYHERIGFIKDIAAGAPAFAALTALIIAGIIYLPKIIAIL
ncbi:diacylglycerol kinase family protein [Tenacibaculum finnmarkense genomovar finnmarkense]|uniref:Diacylglycerol kinase n=2 Tax=Tenacibaculum finnmarkense TaxID=2781243 RepID=A0A2I2M7K5_9FLAO|nr:diacylglycerol kinase family protein [Tenacibaculum finnmarkense]MBE7634712.1 diacylglycerol kinase family protein [Tenacibaculum finnmarkense genomovar ulcerans]MBE7646581.1 diacylglycerol kinase family protein [Tenacibaculum finnmarkense genomovar ulcerans]MBE7648835.1 diacylglycerol kinase family protein [Tenacibaculum finnmarkense genomovar ulcerans]MBE7653437.1 diacylglycerol kinase family protein [Tenacibaculum finnmarkense genomovar finnmarkense]MBE7660560.1 diacylglycerol kinase fam